nr:EOG090X0CKN [Eulimnadia texana]
MAETVASSSSRPNETSSNPSNSQTESTNNTTGESAQQNTWGYDLYPERRGEKAPISWWKAIMGEERRDFQKIECERNVYNCVRNSPFVKLMMSALRSSGCALDIRRHIACEVCDPKVSGGYDPELNQIVVCQNMAKSKELVQGVLTHEMVHMFDYCRHQLDFKNIEHLACTEIRAANLTHCSFLSAVFQGDASFVNIRKQHAECVKTKAMGSVMAVRNVSEAVARAAVDKVFDKCYADLEPIGRRVRRNSEDIHRAYWERHIYGYDED